ncbi:MAG: PorV/PorQ family protein [Elusimicrobia bacterium]|nr:PorV/PorQ family protein [Elusimicrobiota bacterium]
MNIISISIFLLLSSLLSPSFAWSIDSNAGTSGATFLKLGAGSPRALALGRAYVALAEGPESLSWNPAGAALSEQREISFGYMSWVQDFSGNILSYVHPMGRTVWGGNLAYFTLGEFDVRDSEGKPLQGETVNVRDGFGTLTVARSFFVERFFLGASLKAVLEDNDGTRHRNLVGDIGVLYKSIKRLSLGFAYQNLGGNKNEVVQVLRWGGAMKVNPFLGLSLEIDKYSDRGVQPGIGVEFSLPEDFLEIGSMDFRVGYYALDNLGQSFSSTLKKLKLDRTSGISFGFGLNTQGLLGYGMGLDYALVPMGALGNAHHIGIKVEF